MTIKYLIDQKTYSDVRRLDAMFWHEHGSEAVDDMDEPMVSKNGLRIVFGTRNDCQNAANRQCGSTRAPLVYGQGTSNSLI